MADIEPIGSPLVRVSFTGNDCRGFSGRPDGLPDWTCPPKRTVQSAALPALVDGLIARRAIELSTRDTPNRHYGWRRCAATPGRSLTPPVRSDAPPPVQCSLAPAKAQSPHVRQT